MPNYCSNSISLYHEDDAVADAFQKALDAIVSDSKDDNEIGLFGCLRPRPVEENENWYGWNIENWGTKWEVYGFSYERDDNTFYINFDTAWGPPIAWYEYIESLDWQVDALYEEPGMAFVGHYADGYDNFCEYDFENENWRDGLTEDMIEFAGLDDSYENWLEWQEDEEDDD